MYRSLKSESEYSDPDGENAGDPTDGVYAGDPTDGVYAGDPADNSYDGGPGVTVASGGLYAVAEKRGCFKCVKIFPLTRMVQLGSISFNPASVKY